MEIGFRLRGFKMEPTLLKTMMEGLRIDVV